MKRGMQHTVVCLFQQQYSTTNFASLLQVITISLQQHAPIQYPITHPTSLYTYTLPTPVLIRDGFSSPGRFLWFEEKFWKNSGKKLKISVQYNSQFSSKNCSNVNLKMIILGKNLHHELFNWHNEDKINSSRIY